MVDDSGINEQASQRFEPSLRSIAAGKHLIQANETGTHQNFVKDTFQARACAERSIAEQMGIVLKRSLC